MTGQEQPPETGEVLITFDFLCFDAENYLARDAVIVAGVSPHHAAQEYVNNVICPATQVNPSPTIVALRPLHREGDGWDLWKVSPKVVVSYDIMPVTPEELARVQKFQSKPNALPPLQMRPPEHRAPDGRAISRDPADETLGLNGDPSIYR